MPETTPELNRATPESTGLSSANILRFIEAIECAGLELHSLMIMRDHQVVTEGWWSPYRQNDVHLLYSLSKSFTSTAVGFAVVEGLVGIDDPILSIFPDEAPENPSPNLKAMKVRHLLSMATGHEVDDMSKDMTCREDGDWVRGFLARDVPHVPGTHFLYNNGSSYTLSAIVKKVTGMSALDYLRPRLLDPIGIEEAIWPTCPKGASIGASELRITTESILRFGEFYLNKGVWDGKRLISEAWIDLATSFQVSNGDGGESDWAQGYGFQFWRCRHNCYRGDGAFGQFCIVSPDKRMVVAITSSVGDMQAVMNLVWEHLVLKAEAEPLPEDSEALTALHKKLATLTLPGPAGLLISPVIPKVAGRLFKRSSGAEGILTCCYDFDQAGSTFTVRTPEGDRSIRAGSSHWAWGTTSIEGPGGKRIAAMGSWTSEDVYEIKVRYTETPSGITIISRFEGDTVDVKFQLTGRFGSPDGPAFSAELT